MKNENLGASSFQHAPEGEVEDQTNLQEPIFMLAAATVALSDPDWKVSTTFSAARSQGSSSKILQLLRTKVNLSGLAF
jgi:hypothetical protein